MSETSKVPPFDVFKRYDVDLIAWRAKNEVWLVGNPPTENFYVVLWIVTVIGSCCGSLLFTASYFRKFALGTRCRYDTTTKRGIES